MNFPRQSGTLVEAHPRPLPAAFGSRGFTLLEIQIAIVILALAMIGMIGHGRAFERVLSKLQSEHRLDGAAVPSAQRLVVAVAQVGSEASPPRCEVQLDSMEESVGTLSAEIRVTRRMP